MSYLNGPGGIEVLEENNYYPFGLKHEGYNALAGNPSYQYKYNGKELQETGMYDYGARFYMPDIGRWGVVDPLAEKSRRFSTYTYALDNPIMFIDPDGREATTYTGQAAQDMVRQLQSQMPTDDHLINLGSFCLLIIKKQIILS
ncbi:RHS repeat domain-containing protein [Chryseobacterium chendengshani]|uniref:RHS repeat domain-containing protein n=1 Tax=Chryseobacterium sp. LJ668 TaxID=2864040 RepID=UPI0038CF9C66